MSPPVTFVSFGYLHGAPLDAHVTVDVRDHFRDPHAAPALRELTAEDEPVMAAVLATPGILRLVAAVAAAARAFTEGPSPAPAVIAVGCAGGRHRSAAVALAAAVVLAGEGIPAAVIHRDIGKPVTERSAAMRKSQVAKMVRAAREHDAEARKCHEGGKDGRTTAAFRRAESAWVQAMRNATPEERDMFRRVYE